MDDILKKKNKKPLTYIGDVFLHSFVYQTETYVSIDITGMNFISIDSAKTMNIDDVLSDLKSIVIKTICGVEDINKKHFLGNVTNYETGEKLNISKLEIKLIDGEINCFRKGNKV